MDKKQYFDITTVLVGADAVTDKINKIVEILGVNIREPNEAKVLKEKIVGNDTILVTAGSEEVTVSFSGAEATESTFALAFIKTLLAVIGSRAIDKFLPEPDAKVEKTKSASKRDGNASPASDRRLPIRNGASY